MKRIFIAFSIVFILFNLSIARTSHRGDNLGNHRLQENLQCQLKNLVDVSHGSFSSLTSSGTIDINTTEANSDSPSIVFRADNTGSKTRATIRQAYGLDPYLLISVDDDSSTPSLVPVLGIKDTTLSFMTDGMTSLGSPSDNRPSDVNVKYGVTCSSIVGGVVPSTWVARSEVFDGGTIPFILWTLSIRSSSSFCGPVTFCDGIFTGNISMSDTYRILFNGQYGNAFINYYNPYGMRFMTEVGTAMDFGTSTNGITPQKFFRLEMPAVNDGSIVSTMTADGSLYLHKDLHAKVGEFDSLDINGLVYSTKTFSMVFIDTSPICVRVSHNIIFKGMYVETDDNDTTCVYVSSCQTVGGVAVAISTGENITAGNYLANDSLGAWAITSYVTTGGWLIVYLNDTWVTGRPVYVAIKYWELLW